MVKNDNPLTTNQNPENPDPTPPPTGGSPGPSENPNTDDGVFNEMTGPAPLTSTLGVSAAPTNQIYERLGVRPPRGVCVLHPEQTVYISGARALVFDVDETLLVGSARYAHDGVGGRFHGGVNDARREAGLPPIEDDTWEREYEVLAGVKESEVIRRMAVRAGISPARVEFYAGRVLEERIHELLAQVPLAAGARELLINAQEQGLSRGILSASSEQFVARALQKHEVLDHFDARVCSAEKKIDHGVFSGNSFQQICRELGVDPRDAIMIGDSIADYATHRLGVKSVAAQVPEGKDPVSIMIVPNHTENRSKLEGTMSEIEKFHLSHDVRNDHGTLLVISSFKQVRVGPPAGDLCWQVA